MSELKAVQDQLTKALNQVKRQNHHINSQKNFIDEVVSQNLALRTNASILSEALKALEAEKIKLLEVVKRVEELESQLEVYKKAEQPKPEEKPEENKEAA